jgi:heptosyltransferase-2
MAEPGICTKLLINLLSIFTGRKHKRLASQHKVLILASYSGIGNAVQLLPLINELVSKPRATAVDILVSNERAEDIFQRSDQIHKVICYKDPRNVFSRIRVLLRAALKGKYDAALVASTENPVDAGLALCLAGIKIRVGFSNFANDLYTRAVNWDDKLNETANHLRLLDDRNIGDPIMPAKLQINAGDSKWADEYLRCRGITGKKLIGVHPGSSIKLRAKRWPVPKYGGVIKKLLKKTAVQSIIFAGPDEQDVAAELKSQANGLWIAEDLTLGQTIGLISKCSVFLSNDSGLMHIAGNLKVPLVALFGPTDPVKNWGDYKGEIIKGRVDCMPCYAAQKYLTCDNPKCMSSISEDIVLRSVEKYL